jgi:hypothetical protein
MMKASDPRYVIVSALLAQLGALLNPACHYDTAALDRVAHAVDAPAAVDAIRERLGEVMRMGHDG